MPRAPLRKWLDQVASRAGPKPAPIRHLCHALARYMDANGGSCFPSSRSLAEETGMSRNTVDRYLEAAVAQGWLTRGERAATEDRRGWRGFEYAAAIPEGGPEAGSSRGSDAAPPSLVVQGPRKGGSYDGPTHGRKGGSVVAQVVAQPGPEGGSHVEPEVKDGELLATPEVGVTPLSTTLPSVPKPRDGQTGRVCWDGIEAKPVLKEACFRGHDHVELHEGETCGLGVLVTAFQDLVDAGWSPDDLRAAVVKAANLPAGHEDRAPDGPWTLSWLTHSPGRIARLVAESQKQDNPPVGPRGNGLARLKIKPLTAGAPA